MTTPASPLRMLDADVLVDIQRSHPNAVAWYASLSEYPAVSGLVVMELIQDAPSKREVEQALRLVKPLPVAWPTESDFQRALADFRVLNLSQNLGLIDSLIAAATIGLGATLCTFNVKHYRNITGLTLEQPYER